MNMMKRLIEGALRWTIRLGKPGVALVLVAVVAGCGGAKVGEKKEDFFTSGSREADQRASQTMAKHEQITGSGEGAGEKGAKKAKSAKPEE